MKKKKENSNKSSKLLEPTRVYASLKLSNIEA